MGLASAAAGSFGEVASLNACHCLMFNATNKTNVWTLYSGFNTSIQFYIVKPNLSYTTIATSVTNGTIQPNSYYPINVMVVSTSPVNESGYLSAFTGSNTTTKSGGASIRLGANKLIKVAGNGAITNQAPVQKISSNQSTQSTMASTTVQQSVQNIQSKNGSTQSAGAVSAASKVTIPSYLIGAVIVLCIVVCGMGYYIVKGRKPKYKAYKARVKSRKR